MPGLGAGSYSPATLSLVDAGNERGVMRCYGVLLTAVNWAAKQALWTTLVDASMALVLGAKASSQYGDKTTYVWSQPTNGAAREIALLAQWTDNTTGARGTTKLPTLNPAIPDYVVNINVKDGVLLTSPSEITDWISAYNAFAINPATGNQVTVAGLRVVRGGK